MHMAHVKKGLAQLKVHSGLSSSKSSPCQHASDDFVLLLLTHQGLSKAGKRFCGTLSAGCAAPQCKDQPGLAVCDHP